MNWGKYQITVKKQTGDFEKALRLARRAEYTSSVETDEELEKKRKKRCPTKLLSDSDISSTDGSDTDQPQKSGKRVVRLPQAPKQAPTVQSKKAPAVQGKQAPAVQVKQAPVQVKQAPAVKLKQVQQLASGSTTPSRGSNSETTSFQLSVLLKLEAIQEQQQETQDLVRSLTRKLPSNSGQESDREGDTELFENPLDNVNELKMLEQNLRQDDQLKKKLIRYLSLVGGKDPNETAKRVLKKVGTTWLWSDFSLCGRKGKISLKDKYQTCYLVIMKACMKNQPNVKEDVLEKALREYLKRTPNLPGGKNYVLKQQQQDPLNTSTDEGDQQQVKQQEQDLLNTSTDEGDQQPQEQPVVLDGGIVEE